MNESEMLSSDALYCASPKSVNTTPRILGLLAGKANESSDCWDHCEDIEQMFYGPKPS